MQRKGCDNICIVHYNKEVDIYYFLLILQWTNNITYNVIIVIIYVHNIYFLFVLQWTNTTGLYYFDLTPPCVQSFPTLVWVL